MGRFEAMGLAVRAQLSRLGSLDRWLAVGLSWWLLGMLLMASSKQYHQLLMLLFWLPGLLALVTRAEVRRGWRQPMAGVLLVFAAWSALSLLWLPGPAEVGELKIFFYVFLAANALIALASLNPALLLRSLALSGLIAGLLAWLSILWFYGWQERGWHLRVVGTGLANHPILAAQLFGAMGIVLLYLRRELPVVLQGWVWGFACLGYLAFLLLSQSKGPWLAALLTMLAAPLWHRSARLLLVSAGFAGGAVLVALIWPELLLQRGLSSRPELFVQALAVIEQQPLQGLGFTSDYLLRVPSSGSYFEHAHNIYLHIAVILGLVGLACWLALQAVALSTAWRSRESIEGRMLCALLCFAGIALFTDGVGPWVKPREEWFCLWLPVFLVMGLLAQGRSGTGRMATKHG